MWKVKGTYLGANKPVPVNKVNYYTFNMRDELGKLYLISMASEPPFMIAGDDVEIAGDYEGVGERTVKVPYIDKEGETHFKERKAKMILMVAAEVATCH